MVFEKKCTRGAWSVCLGLLGAVAAAEAQNPVTDAQNKLLARRAAEADCYRKLAESVYGVQINSNTTVRDFVTESDEIRSSVEAFVKGIRLGQPRYYEDGACEVDGEVTVAKLVTKLTEVHKEHYKGNVVKTSDFTHLQESIKTDVIKATGSGAPRPELPPDLPQGIEEVITPLPQGYTQTVLSVPAVWKAVGPQGRLMAERGARMDAMRKLLEEIKGLRLNSSTLVRDFITESDEISTQAEGLVVGAAEVGKYLHNDELIVELTMEVPVERLITKITELHKEHYKGRTVTTTDITNIKKILQRDMIRATGSGVPPAKFLQQAQAAGVQMPVWTVERISATGQGTDPEIDTAPQGKLKAAQAARMDAMRKLLEQVNGLQIDSSTLVKDFVVQNDQIVAQLNAVISGATADPPRFSGGVAEVTVSIPAADVWSVVNDQMTIIRRRG